MLPAAAWRGVAGRGGRCSQKLQHSLTPGACLRGRPDVLERCSAECGRVKHTDTHTELTQNTQQTANVAKERLARQYRCDSRLGEYSLLVHCETYSSKFLTAVLLKFIT